MGFGWFPNDGSLDADRKIYQMINNVKTFEFTKMHGISNDYVYVDCFKQSMAQVNAPDLTKLISDRHCGIGSDGLILITPPSPGVKADVRMEMYNADGSRGEMCGNGIRCVAKYSVDHGLIRQSGSIQGVEVSLLVETDRGVLKLVAYRGPDGMVDKVRVDMGVPILRPRDIPVDLPGERCVRAPVEIGGRRLALTCVSMGNPHVVMFVDDVAGIDLPRLGPMIERHPIFPNRVNAHFAQVHSRTEATIRTWERGSGITMACGTGACAVLVAGVLEDRLARAATFHLPGGDLRIEWPESDDDNASVFKTGPAVEVFSGTWRGTT